MPSHPKQPTEHSKSPSAAEEWQLRILQELHKKKPRPTVEQRKLLAAQTGLDAKWIARWFKRVNSCASKGKLQTGTVGCHLSRSQTAPPTQSIDGSNSVKSPSENLAEPTTSGTGASPSVFSAPLEHTCLLSRSGVQVTSENGRSATAHGPYHSRLHSSGWELEHPAVAPDLQENRELARPSFYAHSHGANPVALPRPHTHLVDSQMPLGIVTNSPVYLASQALPPFRPGTSSPNTGSSMDNVKSRNPHSSPSPASAPPSGPLQTPTRYVHVNLVSERSDPAYTELGLGYSHPNLGPGPGSGAGVRARVGPPGTGTHVNLSQAQAVPNFVVPIGSQLVPFESSAPPLSMYWLLFDMELDSVVDQERDDVVTRSSSGGNERMVEPHVTPTPISFFAKWEDMLALERRTRSSSHNAKLVQSKRIQAVHAVEPSRKRQQSGTELMHGQSRPHPLWPRSRSLNRRAALQPDHFSVGHLEEPHKEDVPISYCHGVSIDTHL